MSNLIKVGSDFYILASSLASRRTMRVMANGESFAIFEASGDILQSPLEASGFFRRDTRFLCRFELGIEGQVPYLLNSYLSADNAQLRVNLTNPDLPPGAEVIELARNSLEIERSWVFSDPRLLHRIVIRNFSLAPVSVSLNLSFGADFADAFEVRGVVRKTRGELRPPSFNSAVRLSYLGLDGLTRATDIRFDPAPSELSHEKARFDLALEANQRVVLEQEIVAIDDLAKLDGYLPGPRRFDEALGERHTESETFLAGCARISTNSERMNALLTASLADLAMITSRTGTGYRILGGIPWFATLFGRDSIITARSMLCFHPGLAAGVSRTLAALQGTDCNDRRDEQPGKIVHEVRYGEMARTGEVPFSRYYGSIDSTPLFLCLLGGYVTQTADLTLAEELWPNVERALEWISRWGDRDEDGFVEYRRETPRGLANQGWKDSHDSISHADGTLAEAPIALCEVQAYVYQAYLAIAEIAARMGREHLSSQLEERAANLRLKFQREFWLDDERTVALALDRDKRPCRVMSSNAAHCLAAGLLDDDHAAALSQRLLSEEMFSGWGLRTLSAAERRYNPMSYHNGSVWPQDNAIAALGLARSSQGHGTLKIITGLFQAALDLHGSLPELFCGFAREPRLGPVPYPVACHPQAWSAASIFLTIDAMLGMKIDGFDQRLILDAPMIPDWLEWLKVEDMAVGDGLVSFLARRPSIGPGAAIEILKKQGSVEIEIRK